MSNNDEYIKRLRRIVLHSADTLPDIVSGYLLNNHKNFNAERDILSNLKEYQPIVDHIPHQFVDFALDCLIKKPSVLLDQHSKRLDTNGKWCDQLGINGKNIFLPAAPIQGPFLYLLNQNEDEGIRLVQTLTNVATERWRHQTQIAYPHQPNIIPVPTTIKLVSGLRDFWGDINVYCWFRGIANKEPRAVISALMALEVWMERQIETGRNADELFLKILSGSDCIAVLGICLGIALAYPEKCLKAALPIMSSPMIWEMDISRYASERGTFRFDPLGRNNLVYDLLEERDKRPQRSREIRNLAVIYMLSSDKSITKLFQQATKEFTENLPFLIKGDQDNPEMVAYLIEEA